MTDDWLLTPERVAVHRATGTAVAADLHLGYAEVRRRAGEAVPSVPLETTLSPLAAALVWHRVPLLVLAGDVFEAGASRNAESELLSWANSLNVRLLVIPGNHDKGMKSGKSLLPVSTGPVDVGDWRVVHGDAERPQGRVVQGHLHPCLCLPGTGLRAPCYLISGAHVVLPAYSVEAAGVDVRSFDGWNEYRCHAIAGTQVVDLGQLGKLRGSGAKRSEPRPSASGPCGGWPAR